MRLSDAEKVIRDLTAMKAQLGVDAILIDGMIDVLKRQPKADAVQVIRCKDCKYGKVDNADFHDQYLCNISGSDWNCGNHFCSYGERKDGDGNG